MKTLLAALARLVAALVPVPVPVPVRARRGAPVGGVTVATVVRRR